MEKLQKHLKRILFEKNIEDMDTSFYNKNGYEKAFAQFFEMEQINKKGSKRYWDVEWKDLKIELKKSKTNCYWMDEIRYAEMYLAKNNIECNIDYPEEAKEDTITLFIQTKNEVLTNIFCIDSDKLFDILSITEKWSFTIIKRFKKLKKGLNCQHKLTTKSFDGIEPIKPPKKNLGHYIKKFMKKRDSFTKEDYIEYFADNTMMNKRYLKLFKKKNGMYYQR